MLGDRELPQRLTARHGEIRSALDEAETAWWTGDWNGSCEAAGRALSQARSIGSAVLAGCALASLARVEAGWGREDDCHAHANEVIVLSRRHGVPGLELRGRAALGLLCIGSGRYREAATELTPLRRLSHAAEPEELLVQSIDADLVEALTRCARLSDAHPVAMRLAAEAHAGRPPGARALAGRARALVASRQEASNRYVEALEHHSWVIAPFEQARTELCYGEWLRRHGESRRGRRHLGAATATFERLGAAAWAERARRELRATGTPGGRPAGGPEIRFTPQEHEVSAAVARGATNKEVASALFISAKTVEFHLSSVYRKLGISSRSQLAYALMARDDSRHLLDRVGVGAQAWPATDTVFSADDGLVWG